MMEQTFKKGDRAVIISESISYCTPRLGHHGVVVDNSDVGYDLCLDERGLNKSNGTWYVSKGEIVHDRDFHVGDWVRLEAPDTQHFVPESIEGNYQFIGYKNDKVSRICKGESVLSIATAFLVKIAPPAEEEVSINIPKEVGIGPLGVEILSDAPKTVTIEHDQWGRVEGVTWAHGELDGWEKDGAIRLACDGWREVKPKRWVPVCVAFDGSMRNLKMGTRNNPYEVYFILPEGYRWKKVEIEREEEEG